MKKLGFYQGEIDGIFGTRTQAAVIEFQRNNNLSPDGIVGQNTWNALMPYINGYFIYTIKSGDTFFKIAEANNTSVNSLIAANPNVNYNNLTIGQRIIVPIGKVVPTNIRYTSDILKRNIDSLKVIYPFLKISYIGYTILGKPITCITFRNGPKEIFYNAAIHRKRMDYSPTINEIFRRTLLFLYK